MKIVTIIPIAKGIPREQLSYFSAKEINLGTIVSVLFGRREIKGVVVETLPVREMKTSIKRSDFALRNIATIHKETLPAPLFIAGQKTATFSAQPVGTILKTMLPDQLFEYYLRTPIIVSQSKTHHPDIQAVQVPTLERLGVYKTMVRENLAKHKSTMIIVPTIAHAEFFLGELSPGIEDKIFIIHSKKLKKHIDTTLSSLIKSKDPIVYIATAPFAGIIRSDWDTVIIEESSSSYYRYSFTPIFDMRFFIEQFSKELGARLIYGDTLLDPEIRHRINQREILDLRTTWHIAKPEGTALVNMKPETGDKKKFSLFDSSTKEIIEKSVQEKTSMLFLTTRKGLAPMTMCSDCGTIVNCPACDTPLVLHKKKTTEKTESRIYMCHNCMHTTEPIDTCKTCGGWKLTLLGISTGAIADELEKMFPKNPCYIIDGESSTTTTTIQKTIASWQEHRGSFLVATPMALSYITQVPQGCIVSFDSLLSLPTLASGYQALRTAMIFLEKVTKSAIIQTRIADHEVMRAISHENIFEFMKNELKSREQFNYPPFKVLLKLTITIPIKEARQASEYLEQLFSNWQPDLLMKKAVKANHIAISAILKIDPAVWKDDESPLHDLLRNLDKSFIREINPESVL